MQYGKISSVFLSTLLSVIPCFQKNKLYRLAFFLVILLANVNSAHARFLGEDVTVLVGPRDAIFKVCNQTDEPLYLAFVFKHVWKWNEPPTWPAKGWFQLNRSGCQDVAVNGLFGVMAVMYKDKGGVMHPFYSGSDIPLKDATVGPGESMQIEPEQLCLDEAPYTGYRDQYTQYYECNEGAEHVPFQILFNADPNSHFSLMLN